MHLLLKTISIVSACSVAALAGPASVQLWVDFSEAEQALRIIQKQAAHLTITPEDWRQLFATVPYQQLKAREAAIGAPFSDQDFQNFLLSREALAAQADWEKAVTGMKRADMTSIGERVLTWLPSGATIHARVYPEIKPRANSFVWAKPGDDAAIFLSVGKQTQGQFENTVAHECHHIGLESLNKQQEAIQARLPENIKKAMDFLGAFGEGEAMLAAAGSVDRHPHAEDDALIRARWDSDLMHFNADVAALQLFFTEILDGKFKDDNAIMQRAAPFWGVQGAWYTVGYEMAALVERRYGRQAFRECLIDPRKLLTLYNQIANDARPQGASLATWSGELLSRLSP
jgi:hypothetical protein